MASKEEFEDVVLRENERKLFMSRVPKKTKEEFVAFANEEFCQDYGMAFKSLWDSYKLWKVFFENVDYKLDEIKMGLDKIHTEEEPEKVKMLSGRKVEKGVKN